MLTTVRSRLTQSACRQLITPVLSTVHPPRVASTVLTPRPIISSFAITTNPRSFASHAIVVPSMGDSISDGTLAELLVEVGAGVEVDQVVAKIDTDKVSVDIRSTVPGKVSKWNAKVGDVVKVGANLLEVEVGAAGSAPVKQVGATQTSAAKPNADVGEKTSAPLAQSGTQSPQSMHPTDPHDTPHRIPSISFRYGKRDASGAVGVHRGGHQHQGNQPAPQSQAGDVDFLSANEAAAAAWEALPARYKKKPLKEAQLYVIELGGASNYESKKKVKA